MVVIHQPDFAPYLGFFDRLLVADLWVVLDHVQFSSGGSDCWTHRDRIKTPSGPAWLTLKLVKPRLGTPIDQVMLDPAPAWRDRHLALLERAYGGCPGFGEVMPGLVGLYRGGAVGMADFNLRSIRLLMELLRIDVPMCRSSAMGPQGRGNDMLIDLIRKVGHSGYLSGTGAAAYMDVGRFTRAGIRVQWQRFVHPVYPQPFGPFVPNLSTIDLLMNLGPAAAGRLLRAASRHAPGPH